MATLSFVTRTPVLNIPLLSRLYTILSITHLILHSHLFTSTSSKPITHLTQKIIFHLTTPILQILWFPITTVQNNNFRQFNLLNVKKCTETPSDIQHASVKARVYVRAKAKRIKAFKCVAYAKKKNAKFVFKDQLNIVVLIELYGITIHYHFLLPSILYNAIIT